MRNYILMVAALLTPVQASAFCGFFVAKADADLFNDASKAVIARKDNRTVITMANDYRGEPSEFAMVIPVPEVLKRAQINIGHSKDIDHLDAYTAPRLAEYYDEDPCRPMIAERMMMSSAPMTMADGMQTMRKNAKDLGVRIEAEYQVGEYDIQILSGKESSGLITWLNQEGYRIPDGADETVGSYIKQNMFFFLAKINLERKQEEGSVMLRPLQVAFESKKFMLPIRLGTLNAESMQDLILYVLTEKGRVEPVNYRMTKIPSDIDIPAFIKTENSFGEFYKDMFMTAAKKEDFRTVFLEYAWNMSWCDPCAADPLTSQQLRSLGAYWVQKKEANTLQPMQRRMMPQRPANVYVTRMHVRYDNERFPEDLKFQETPDTSNFQGRYVIRHTWKGKESESCDAADAYFDALPARLDERAENLARLTGRDIHTIRAKMKDLMPSNRPKKDPRPWYEKMWSDMDARTASDVEVK